MSSSDTDTEQTKSSAKNWISTMVEAAISADVLNDTGDGLLAIMSKSGLNIQKDIPATFEMYTLLSHFSTRLPLVASQLTDNEAVLAIAPAIHHDMSNGRIVALIPIKSREMGEVAFWISDCLPSERIRQMAGMLSICFSIETHSGVDRLLPEWFVSFYVDADPRQCIPILALRSVLSNEKFSGDWVEIALNRMSVFGLPTADAVEAIKKRSENNEIKPPSSHIV